VELPHAANTRLTLAVRMGYVGVIALATLTSLRLDPDIFEALQRLPAAFNLELAPRVLVDAIRNVVLFAGWGALWVITAPKRPAAIGVALATLTGFLLSFSVETVQLLSPIRRTSILDVTTNTLGSLIGALSVVAMVAVARHLRSRKSYVGVPAMLFAAAYFCAAFLEAAVLTRPTPIPGMHGGPSTRFWTGLGDIQFLSLSGLNVGDVILFVPLGAFLVAAMVKAGWTYSRATWLTVVVGIVSTAVAELSRGALGLQMNLGAVLLHSSGVVIGAGTTFRWLPGLTQRIRGRYRPLALLATYAFVLMLWSWRPFLPETDIRTILDQLSVVRLIPLHAQGWRLDMYSVADIVAPFFLFLPVGGLLAVWPLQRNGWLAGMLPGLYLAMITELGQILIADRYFGGTDMIVQCAGVAIGWMVIRIAGYEPHGVMLPQ
jgi:glycopeptide antibiotics resistance protein